MILFLITSIVMAQTAVIPNNTVAIGKTGANNKTIEFNVGKAGTSTNPKLKWDNSTSKLQFSNDGTTFSDIGSPSSFDSSTNIENLGISATVAANALTIALKTKGGSDPSVASPVNVSFRSSTLTSGTYSTVSITGALSMTVSSGSTLGSVSAFQSNVYVYLINNAGTAELAVSGSLYISDGVISTTAEGGAGAADAVDVVYSTSARSNVAYKLIGRVLSTQATAGTWATSPTVVGINHIPSGSISNNGRNLVIEGAQGTCSSSSSIASQSGTWLASIGNVSSGDCLFTMSGVPMSIVSCWANGPNSGTDTTIVSWKISAATSSTFTMSGAAVTTGSSTIASITNTSFSVFCLGWR